MDRWKGKVAVVTGASAGIGLEIVKSLVAEGMAVVGIARRKDKMLKEMSGIEGPGKFHAMGCDITKKNEVIEAFDNVKKNLKTVHVLINNAGFLTTKTIEDASMEEMEQIINCNIMGLLHCTKLALKLMKENGDEGYIVNMCSTLGHIVPNLAVPMNIYSASKFAVRAISETLINELRGTKIRITNLSPGLVATDAVNDIDQFKNLPALQAEDIANVVSYILSTPHHVEITELIMKNLYRN